MRRLGLLLTLFIFLAPGAMNAQTEGVLNSLLAPGPLMGGHHDLEKTGCFKCHDAGKGVPASKCLDCHKEIKRYVDQKTGLHGMTTQSCTACHSDHKGRDYDSVFVDSKTFDHGKMTGYRLEGKHADLKCVECHKEKRSKKFLRPNDPHYLGAATSCRVCHKKDDIHAFSGKYAKQDCNSCHGNLSWKQDIKFDHNKDTKFKLEESHATLKCNDCHMVDKARKTMKYQWANLEKSQCLSCHKDFHANKLSAKFRGGDCLKCHTQTHWKMEAKFDHKVTGYPLRGKHLDLQCIECHKQPGIKATDAKRATNIKNFNWVGLKAQCLTCHKDFHKFGNFKSKGLKNPNQCLKCHEESSWKKTHDFAHDSDTRYKIDGKHTELNCNECHLPAAKNDNPTRMPNARQGVYHWAQLESKTCENCHKNPHIGQFKPAVLAKGCTSCHTTSGWKNMKSDSAFDHSKTRFALSGAHTNVSCNECHLVGGKKIYKFASAEQKFCIDCHSNVHKKQFSAKFSAQQCTQCHSTKNFTERLDFDHALTGYKLEGSHAKLNCAECHKPTNRAFNLTKPNISQKEIDAHRNPFMGKFLFPEMKVKQCLTCHSDYHRGQLGVNCQTCHTESAWKKLTFDHNRSSAFPLTDKHVGVECKECHVPIKGQFTQYLKEKRPLIRYKPIGLECSQCHKDAHKGQFGTKCMECHTARGWKVTKDFHKNFLLKGVHYSLDCVECHKDGRKLSGLSQDCMFCHQKDDIHHGTLPNCKDCHTQSFWEHTGFKHSLTRFPLRGVHRTLECGDCHNRGGAQTMYQGLDSRCESCHMRDAMSASTPHSGTMLINCQECHKNFFRFGNR